MDPRVAIEAPLGQNPLACPERRNIVAAIERRGMERFHVALLTQKRGSDFQKPDLGRAVRRMTR